MNNYKKILEWIYRHKVASMVIVLLIILGVPFLIHVLFKIKAPISFMEHEWSAGELLDYYGSVLAFAGTVIFSALALWQNQIIKEESDRHTEMLKKMEIQKHMPFFCLDDMYSSGDNQNMAIRLHNKSDNFADEINVENFEVLDSERKVVNVSQSANVEKLSLIGGDSMLIRFKNSRFNGENRVIRIKFNCIDKFNEIHYYEACSLKENINRFKIRET